MTRVRTLVPYVWYPLGVACAIALFQAMRAAHAPIAATVYAPIALVAVAIMLLQWGFPERADWRPSWRDVRVDLLFIAVVQVALPRLLAIVFALALADRAHAWFPSRLWPHRWPVLAQVALMVLAVDFLRYWLHRACHRFAALWKLHAVHHAPRLLYSLNAARFHPGEKALHFCADTVPFVALGVAQDVIAGYFVVYSVNGFFQHSNARLRYGWLNYIVGSAETHRWHHSRNARVGACNYGSTTVVWDVVFGTWRLPRGSCVGVVGIPADHGADGFAAQMLMPFLAPKDASRRTWRRRVADALVHCRLRWTLAVERRRLRAMSCDPMRVQHALLRRIMFANRDTVFGRRHRFADIDGYAAFARQVRIAQFEDLRPYIDAEIEGSERELTAERPAHYVRTSGSTGRPKDIPLTPTHLRSLRRIHETSVAFQYRQCPQAFDGGILAIVSPAREGTLGGGQPFGSASGIVAGDTPAPVREKFVVPAPVLAIADSRVKYLLILRLAIATRDITYVGAANATTLLALMRLYREHCGELVADLRNGTFFLAAETPADVLAFVAPRLRPRPERADELARLNARVAPPRLADLWPDLRLAVTWTGGSAGTAVDALRRQLAATTSVLELGYVASEFRGTITLGRRAASGFPTIDTHFFEFIERERWDRGERELVTLDRVRKGIDYYVVVTTPSGLYRYFINDLVRVTGFLDRTPLLRFVQKGKGVTSITGEKLYEAQVLTAVRRAMADAAAAARFFVMLADDAACRYDLYVESDAATPGDAAALARTVDAALAAQNVEYAAKRESGRLAPLRVHWLSERTADRYKEHCVAGGQREGQFKPTALAYRNTFGFAIDSYVAAA